MATLEEAQNLCRDLPQEDLGRLRTWITTIELPRRAAMPQIEQALAEETEKLWEAHPELKPKFETGPVEVTPTTKDGRITLAALLKAYPPFKQPTGAHDALPPGAQVSDEGRIWRNDLDRLNVWKPGTMNAGWTDITDMLLAELNPPEPEPEGDAQDTTEQDAAPGVEDFRQPTGAHDAYSTGDEVRFEGEIYESTIDNNAYSPHKYPQGWRKK